ncbi:MAG: WD40-repeat-containing domain protein, partial [Benniella sp.]
DNGDIHVYSTSTWEISQTLKGHGEAIQGLKYSPDGDMIVSGSRDGTVRLWILGSGACQDVLTDHVDIVTSVAYSPSG